MFVEARAHEFYVCYQKKILLEEHKQRYIGCIAHEEKCKTFNMKHFGKYPTQNALENALIRCKKSSPKFVNTGVSTMTDKEWRKAIYTNSNDTNTIYVKKNEKSTSIGYLSDFIIFNYKKIDGSWYKVKTSDKYGLGTGTTGFSKLNKNNIIKLSVQADYIDALIQYLKLNSIEVENQKIKIDPKVLVYFQSIVRKNYYNHSKLITVHLSKKERYHLQVLYKWFIKHMIYVWANDIIYTKNANDARVVSVYLKSLFDIEKILNIQENSDDFGYLIKDSLFPLNGYEQLSFCANDKEYSNKGYQNYCHSINKKSILSLISPVHQSISLKINGKMAYTLYQTIKNGKNKLYEIYSKYREIENSAYWFYQHKDYGKSIYLFKVLMKIAYAEHEAVGRIENYREYIAIAKNYYYLNNNNLHNVYIQKATDELKLFYGQNSVELLNVYKELEKFYFNNGAHNKAYLYSLKSFYIYKNHIKNFFILLNSKDKNLFLKLNFNIVSSLLTNTYFVKNNTLIVQKTFNAWLSYKGNVFDSENAIAILRYMTKDKDLKEKIDSLLLEKRQLAELYQQIPKTKEKEIWQNKIKELKNNINVLNQVITKKSISYKEVQELEKVTYKDIAKNLKDNDIYIDFAKAGKNYYIFTLDSKEKITFRQIDKNATREIDKNVKAFRDDIKTIVNSSKLSKEELTKLQKQSKDTLAKLYSLVLEKPLKDILPKYSSLIISSDGALRLLPFEALYDAKKSKYLIEEKNLKYIPSGKELIRLFKFAKKAENKNQAVVIADPDFNKNVIAPKAEEMASTPNTKRGAIIKSLFKMHFKPLPGTKQEAKEIAQTIKEKIGLNEFIKDKATEQNLYKVNSPKFLHIATHGFFIKDNTIPNPMLKSGIALTGANAGAIKGNGVGIVTALKLSGLNLKGTDLVVLSACETGVVDTNSTESVSGLAKAFIQAGAKDIVMSLWSVDDKATKDLMTQFYKNISAGDTYAAALKKAKLKMIKENMHPYYWAAFIMSGL